MKKKKLTEAQIRRLVEEIYNSIVEGCDCGTPGCDCVPYSDHVMFGDAEDEELSSCDDEDCDDETQPVGYVRKNLKDIV